MKIVLLSLGVVLVAVVLQPNIHKVFRHGVKWDGPWPPFHQEATDMALRKKRAVTIKKHEIKFHERDGDGNVIVPYNISYEFSEKEVKMIEKLMADIGKNTCIRFKRRTPSSEQGSPFIQFKASSNGNCIYERGIYHEILHSLGVHHEHKRPDRDDYITIHHDNIMDGVGEQFEKLLDDAVETHGTPYDFYSVMHYGKRGLGKNRAITIETHDPYYQDKIGQVKPSIFDYQAVCNLYKCDICMGEWKVPLPEHPIEDNLNRRGFY
ncbi:hypothetical protein Q1695_004575 [Nippostrongylus brasiliensis]|nr:hypothetical protein Q1695_004575 [Nippostrongylus brasiliensis]